MSSEDYGDGVGSHWQREIESLRTALAAEREAHEETKRELARVDRERAHQIDLRNGTIAASRSAYRSAIARAENAEREIARLVAVEPGHTDVAAADCHICHHDPKRRSVCSACRPRHCHGCWARDLADAIVRAEKAEAACAAMGDAAKNLGAGLRAAIAHLNRAPRERIGVLANVLERLASTDPDVLDEIPDCAKDGGKEPR